MEGLRLDVGSQRRRSGKIKAFPSSKIAFNITKDIMKIVRTNISECMLLLGNRRGGAFRGPGFFFKILATILFRFPCCVLSYFVM